MTTRVPRAPRTALLCASLVLMCGCATGAAGGSSPSCLPVTRGDSEIDWVPFVVVDGQMYATSYDSSEQVLDPEQTGDVVATVSCRIAEVGDPDFQPRDGDAAYLPVGAELRQVQGRATEEALTALEDGQWYLFTAVDE